MNRVHDRKEHQKNLRCNNLRKAERFVMAVLLFRCQPRISSMTLRREMNNFWADWDRKAEERALRLQALRDDRGPSYIARLSRRGTLEKALEAVQL